MKKLNAEITGGRDNIILRIIDAVRIHTIFTAIHPFKDGNGRTK